MSTTGKEYKLAIKIAGAVDKTFKTSISEATTEVSKFKATINAMDKDFTRLDKGFDKIVGTGKKCFSAIATAAGVAATAIGAAAAASVAVGSEFESAFAGVKKTVDETEEGYERLKQIILDMSREIPSSQSEIAKVMEIAGQLGIDKYGEEALASFTETMINLGVSTNLAAEEAASALAKFANITGMDPADYERLGSAIVELGNNFATTEADIVEMATRLASTGDLVGLSEAEILALSTAMSSVGIAAESGGSTMSKLLKKMQMAVEKNGSALRKYASVAGMTGAEFKQAFQENAVVAMSAFIDGLNDTERNGKSAIAILDDLGLNEIRLSNTILALAGAEGVMSEAVRTAIEAWKENNALSEEAEKRYETAASKLQIMNNAFKELGIVAYEDLREPYVDAISAITNKVYDLTEFVGGPNGIGKWLDNIGTALPTLQRKFKQYGEPVFNGIWNVGKWVVKNGKGIISVFAGIGAAMATYKIASTLTHVVKAIMSLASLNPATLAILGLVAAVGLLTTAFAAYKQHERELIDQNLADHFGNITLSMEELQAVAEHIIGADSLGGVKEALEKFSDLDTFAGTMENAIEEINRMNWKVSIGMELTADDQESYKTAIAEYVSSAQEYALQSQYAVHLSLDLGLGDDLEGRENILGKVNLFYQKSYDAMASLGEQLSDAVNEAFADNILDPEEINVIADLQAKMAKVQQSLATGEYDAALSLLGEKYAGGGSLTADTFKNLQAELANQVSEATAAYDDAYKKNYAAIQATYDAGGYLSDAAYQEALDNLKKERLQNVTDLQMKAINFQLETIMGQYSDEFGAFSEVFDSVLAGAGDYDWVNSPLTTINSLMNEIFTDDSIDDTTKKAIEELMESMEPTIAQAEALKQEYAELGIELSEEMVEAFSKIDLLGAITVRSGLFGIGHAGDREALRNLIVSEIANNESYSEIANTIRGYGWEIPINQRANGGLATRPELTWFAENGPEMAIPIDGSRNAISLWEQAGRLLGMGSVLDGVDLSGGGSGGPTIEYNPTLQFYGAAPSRDDLEGALRVSQDEFEGLMERYFKTHGRVSFG